MYCVPEKEISLLTYKDKYSTLQEEHPEWTPHELRLTSAIELRPQFQADRETAARENLGLPMCEIPEAAFTITDEGKVWYPNYGSGIGLMQLSERQKRLRPEYYSSEEHAISLLIEEQFTNGATEVVTSYGDRDVVIMRYDPITKTGTTEIINTAVLLEKKHQSIQEFISEHFPKLESVSVTKNVFLFADKKMSLEQAKKIVQPVLKEFVPFKQQHYIEDQKYNEVMDQQKKLTFFPLPFLRHPIIEETQQISVAPSLKEKQKRIVVTEEPIQKAKIVEKTKVITNVEQSMQTHVSYESTSHVPVLIYQFSKKEEKKTENYPQIVLPVTTFVVVSDVQTIPTYAEKMLTVTLSAVKQIYAEEKVKADMMMGEQHAFYIRQFKKMEQTIDEQSAIVEETYTQKIDHSLAEVDMFYEVDQICIQDMHTLIDSFATQVKLGEIATGVKKLVWMESNDQAELIPVEEVEIVQDATKTLHNLLHFLRKIVRTYSGNDVVRERVIQRIDSDQQGGEIEELEEYLNILQARQLRGHMYAFVN
ncbi:MAG: hypothetical protein V1917_03580 [Candidatus Gottesmanbacteria bacterium]